MTIDELIQREMAPQSFDWWGTHYENVAPALATKILGDGGTLLGIQSMDTRPHYWLIRVDSEAAKMDDDNLSEYVTPGVIEAISHEFGECTCTEDCDCAFPMLILNSGGYNWWVVQP